MAGIALEDNFTDIIGKAQGGLGLADAALARRAGVSVDQVHAAKTWNPPLNPLRGRGSAGEAQARNPALDPRHGGQALCGRGGIDDEVIRKLAAALNLGADALVASANQVWYPADPGPVDGLACFNTPFTGMTVNSYLVFDAQTRIAAAFDTGTDADPLLTFARERALKIALILLTHTHGDHVYDLDRLKEATGAPAYVSERETIAGANAFEDGHVFELVEQPTQKLTVRLTIETRRTSGHARGGTTFVVTRPIAPTVKSGLPQFAIAGDALFAGSMGGGMVNYAEALQTNRESIFTLPDDTIICPGHGPLTTVGEEKAHNPFFPEFQK